MEVSPIRTHAIESNHIIEKGRTPFARTGMDKQSNRNRGDDIILMYYPWSSTPQSPSEQGARLGSGIGNQVSRLNYMHT